MKKASIFLFAMMSFLFMLLCSCGGQMDGWPTFDLNLDIGSCDEVSLEFNRLPYGRNDTEYHFSGTSADKQTIIDIYNAVNGLPYSEKIYKTIDTENYYENVIIKFKDGEGEYVFKFYSYGVTNGYFVFDNGEIHRYYGDFISGTYEKFKDKLSQ